MDEQDTIIEILTIQLPCEIHMLKLNGCVAFGWILTQKEQDYGVQVLNWMQISWLKIMGKTLNTTASSPSLRNFGLDT